MHHSPFSTLSISLFVPTMASQPFSHHSSSHCVSSHLTRSPHPLSTNILEKALHLPTHRNNDILHGAIILLIRPHILNLAHHVHAVDHFTKDDVLVIEMRQGHCRDEELGAVCVGARVLVGVGSVMKFECWGLGCWRED